MQTLLLPSEGKTIVSLMTAKCIIEELPCVNALTQGPV